MALYYLRLDPATDEPVWEAAGGSKQYLAANTTTDVVFWDPLAVGSDRPLIIDNFVDQPTWA